ncbi:MAG: MOSC domain-containing protein [Fulvivirga sp.]|uniref:MOSC domain-containing protein n=1 Tax=Fulvivirga sp. TaxID=1931237 RepID=UPI0032EB0A03
MKLSRIIIYPIKSLGGIELESSITTQRGLEYDRRFMLIDENNKFLTIRQHKEFLFYQLKKSESGFTIQHKNKTQQLHIPWAISTGKKITAKIWDDEVEAVVAEDHINTWFSNELGFNCRLVYLPDESPRRVQPDWVKNEHHVSLADAYPYLIVGENSVADLNAKIQESITYKRFRPNLVFTGGQAYEEFLWKDITIGAAELQCIKPCTRCIVITMNPETAEVGKEPLKTLFKQRINEKMVFGENAILLAGSLVKVGDEITIISKKDDPYEKVE